MKTSIFAIFIVVCCIFRTCQGDCGWCQILPKVTPSDCQAYGAENPFFGSLQVDQGRCVHKINCGSCVSSFPATSGCKFCPVNILDPLIGTCEDDAATGCEDGGIALARACPLDLYEHQKLRGDVYPGKYSYFYITPPNNYLTLRLVARTTNESTGAKYDTAKLGDNISLFVKRSAIRSVRYDLLTHSSQFITPLDLPSLHSRTYDFRSVRESNPWAIDVHRSNFDCALGSSSNGISATLCAPFVIGVLGDNQPPSAAGPSQFELYWYYDFDFPDFSCAVAPSPDVNLITGAHQRCPFLEIDPRATVAISARSSRKIFEFPGVTTLDPSNQALGFSQVIDGTTTNFVNFVKSSYFRNGEFFEYDVMRLISTSMPPLVANVTNFQRKGAVYYNDPKKVDRGFEVRFKFRISNQFPCGGTDGFCGGGDGFSFVLHNPSDAFDPLPSTATSLLHQAWDKNVLSRGAGMGYANLSRSLAVEFDTWFNPDYYDPKLGTEQWWINATNVVSYSDNHIAIFSHGSLPNSADHSSRALISATPSIPNFSDGEIHKIKIWYVPRTGAFPGSLHVFMDDWERPALVADVSIEKALWDPRGVTCQGQLSFVDTISLFAQFPDSALYDFRISHSPGLEVWPSVFSFSKYDWQEQRTLFVYSSKTAVDSAAEWVQIDTVATFGGTALIVPQSITLSGLKVINTDLPRLVISESAGSTLVGPGSAKGTDQISISLTVRPSRFEVIKLLYTISEPSCASQLTFDPPIETLSFSFKNWNLPKRVTISSASGCPFGTTVPVIFAVNSTLVGGNSTRVYASAPTTSLNVFSLDPTQTILVIETNGYTAVRMGDTPVSDVVRFIPFADTPALTPGDITFAKKDPLVPTSASHPLHACLDDSLTVTVQPTGHYDVTFEPTPTNDLAAAECVPLSGSLSYFNPNYPPNKGKYDTQIVASHTQTRTFWPSSILTISLLDSSNLPGSVKFMGPIALQSFGATQMLKSTQERCVADDSGKAYLGFTAATGSTSQDMDILSWSFCHKLGCVAC